MGHHQNQKKQSLSFLYLFLYPMITLGHEEKIQMHKQRVRWVLWHEREHKRITTNRNLSQMGKKPNTNRSESLLCLFSFIRQQLGRTTTCGSVERDEWIRELMDYQKKSINTKNWDLLFIPLEVSYGMPHQDVHRVCSRTRFSHPEKPTQHLQSCHNKFTITYQLCQQRSRPP